MISLCITEEPDFKKCVRTKIVQTGAEALQINLFLEQSFVVYKDATYTYESIDQVLCDILIGIQLYNIQYPETSVLLDISVGYRRKQANAIVYEMVQDFIECGRKAGHKIALNEPGNKKNNDRSQHNKDEVIKMERNYDMVCPSFTDFTKKVENGQNKAQKLLSRQQAMDFAHPVDAVIIGVLDNPVINKAFSKFVELSADMNYGLMLSTGIRVDQNNPDVAPALETCAETLGITVPYTVVSSSIAGLNAMTFGTDECHYIAISSLMKVMMSREELMFVLGHECGHIALGHVLYHTVLSTVQSAAELIPVVGHSLYQVAVWPMMAWYRRSEISADRAGLLCCGDINVACRTLLRLECGFMNADGLDTEEYIANTHAKLSNSVLGRYQELLRSHPILAKRMEALQLFIRSEKYYRLSGKPVPEGMTLLSDSELDNGTENIVKVIK